MNLPLGSLGDDADFSGTIISGPNTSTTDNPTVTGGSDSSTGGGDMSTLPLTTVNIPALFGSPGSGPGDGSGVGLPCPSGWTCTLFKNIPDIFIWIAVGLVGIAVLKGKK